MFSCFSVFAKQEAKKQLVNKPPVFSFTNKQIIIQLYQLLKDTHELLTLKNIQYWVIAGTLLGAVRHSGIIPWDDDLDICIDKKQNSDFVALKPFFEQLGYHIKSWTDRVGHRVFLKDQHNNILDYPHMDVVVYEQKGDKICYRWKKSKQQFKIESINVFDLFPITNYRFGNFWVKGPCHPFKYLTSCYGQDCMDFAYCLASHSDASNAKKGKIKLVSCDKVPAMPIEPLQNKVAKTSLVNNISMEVIKISHNNVEKIQTSLDALSSIYVEAFEWQTKNQLIEEHADLYNVLEKTGETVRDLLLQKFNKVLKTFIIESNSCNNSYVIILKNEKDIPIGYMFFVQAPIKQILQSMIARKYITAILSEPKELIAPEGSAVDDAYVLSVAVTPSCQNLGFGKKLIFSIFLQCPMVKNIYLLTADSKTNIAVHRFYEHLGFKQHGILLTADNNQKILYFFHKY